MVKDIFMDAGADVLKMLPFLMAAFLVIEALEHYSTEFTKKLLRRVGRAGPAVGAVAGCVPQCGFSVMASNLYAGGVISVGTLLAVFVATSDEAVLIMLGNPGQERQILALLAVKTGIAVLAGYGAEFFLARYISVSREDGDLCEHCGCKEDGAGIFLPALRHTVTIFFYLFLFTAALNLCMETMGEERLAALLLGDTWFQPMAAALVGLIPNCAASVILTQLYLNGTISFASVIAGLCTGAGAGLPVLFKMNKNRRESLKIVGVLYGIGVLAGVIIRLAGSFIPV